MKKTTALSIVLAAGTMSAGATVHAKQQAAGKDEVRAIVAEMLADAETRTSLLADGATAGHDGKRFFIAGADGAFKLTIHGQQQIRYIMNFRDDPEAVSGGNNGDDFDPGFQLRRTKVNFEGQLYNDWLFKIQPSWSRTGDTVLEEAWVAYKWTDQLRLTVGQFKLPFLHEELVSSTRQLAVERTITNDSYTQDRSQGVQLAYDEADWRAAVAFSDGLDSENTDFTNQALIGASPLGAPFIIAGEADYAFTGRFEYKFAGSWDQYADFTSKPGEPMMLVVGAAAHFQGSPNTGNGTDVDRQTFTYTADIAFENNGFNAYGAFIGRHDDFRAATGDLNLDEFGFVVQAGYRFTNDWEVFGRWDGIIPDDARNLDKDLYSWLTGGVNYYIHGHAVKLTGDVVYALEETQDIANVPVPGGPGGATRILPMSGSGLLGSSGNEVVVRLQLQLLF